MDKAKAQEFVDKYVELCKKYGMHLWSGEPWYGLDLCENVTTEESIGKNIEEIIRQNIMVYDD